MFTVALIGGDGAGKTTISNLVLHSSRLRMKYLYMGMSARSNTHSLPTSRLVYYIKQRIYKKKAQDDEMPHPEVIPANQLEYSEKSHGWIWNTARFLNRLAEAWYRQFISYIYQLGGFVVLYDRHYFFDAAPVLINSQDRSTLLDRLYFWLMTYVYPKPSLTIFLDASPELLFRRKGEASPAYLSKQRSIFLAQGKKLKYFICVDASAPIDMVLNEVNQHILNYYTLRNPRPNYRNLMDNMRDSTNESHNE